MAKPIQGKDGKFQGSVGDGKDNVPTPLRLVRDNSTVGSAAPKQVDYTQQWDAYEKATAGQDDASFATKWEQHQRDRDDQGLQRHSVPPRTVNEKYTIQPKKDPATGDTYYVARVAATGKMGTFPSQHKAEDWVQMQTGQPLVADNKYAYKSHIHDVEDNDIYSNRGAHTRQDGNGVTHVAPVVQYTEDVEYLGKHTFHVYRHEGDAGEGDVWEVELERENPFNGATTITGGPVWEGDKPPTRDDLIEAAETYNEQ